MSEQTLSPDDTLQLRPEQGTQLATGLLIMACVAGAATLLGLLLEDTRRQAYFSYLTALVFVVQIAVGSLFWVLLHHLTGAGWSVVIRRQQENVSRFLTVALVFFLPLLSGLPLL